MKFLKIFSKEKNLEDTAETKPNLEEKLLSQISKTFDEEIKSEDSISEKSKKKIKELNKKAEKKNRKKKSQSSGESESESSSEEEEGNSSESESSDEEKIKKKRAKEVLQEYTLVQANNAGACFAHLSFKVIGAFW